MENEGFIVPLHRSLTEPLKFFGLPHSYGALVFTVCGGLGMALQSIYAIPVTLILFCLGKFMMKKDPQFFDCFLCHVKHCKYYDP